MFIGVLLLPLSLFAHEGLGIEGEEIQAIGNLVEATTAQLATQKDIKSWMEQYLTLKKKFAKGDDEKRVGFQMVQLSKKILTTLREDHLEDLVPSAYIDELAFFTTLAKEK